MFPREFPAKLADGAAGIAGVPIMGNVAMNTADELGFVMPDRGMVTLPSSRPPIVTFVKERDGGPIDGFGNNDVLCGRGGQTNNHAGNVLWRELVKMNQVPYMEMPKRQKMLVSKAIVSWVRSQNPPGRFLSKDIGTGKWYDIGDKKAGEKTSQALREGLPKIRHSEERKVAEQLKQLQDLEQAEKLKRELFMANNEAARSFAAQQRQLQNSRQQAAAAAAKVATRRVATQAQMLQQNQSAVAANAAANAILASSLAAPPPYASIAAQLQHEAAMNAYVQAAYGVGSPLLGGPGLPSAGALSSLYAPSLAAAVAARRTQNLQDMSGIPPTTNLYRRVSFEQQQQNISLDPASLAAAAPDASMLRRFVSAESGGGSLHALRAARKRQLAHRAGELISGKTRFRPTAVDDLMESDGDEGDNSDDERVEEEYRLAAGLSEKTDGKPSAKKRKISASKGNTKNKRAATKEESNDGTGSNPLELLMNTAADQKRKA